MIDLARYRFDLPPELLARYPVEQRDQSRLMLVDPGDGRIEEIGPFRKIRNLLRAGDLLVFNRARVSKMRLVGKRRTGGKVEAILFEKTPDGFIGLLRPLTKIKIGEPLEFRGATGRLIDRFADGRVLMDFGDVTLEKLTETAGEIPIPPYLKRSAERIDEERYQTVLAEEPGAAAAPTAALHFTRELLGELASAGVEIARVNLTVGYGTFAPIEGTEDSLHEEAYSISAKSADQIASARAEGRRVVAVGTTVVRALESFARSGRFKGRTDLFIRPGYSFKIIDAMITNFHLSESSLLVLVHAFAGELIFEAYRRAIDERYRFFSYGDVMFIPRRGSSA